MKYLILDPMGNYAAHMMEFLDRLELDGVAVLTEPRKLASWKHKWSHRLGSRVVDTFLVGGNVRALARKIDRKHPDGFAGIIPWDELTILLGAELGEYLDLGWNPRKVIERFRDKYVMKEFLRRTPSVRINASRVVRNADQAFDFQEELDRWPLVVKPSSGAGAMSVFFAENGAELLRYCQRVREQGLGGVLLEEYVDGQELAVNGIVDHKGDFLATDVWRYDKRSSHGVHNLYYESRAIPTSDPLFWPVVRYAADVVEALELRRAPVHMEVKVDDRGPCLIEVGARFAGGDQPVLASKLHGRSLFELAACHYLADLPLSVREVNYERYDAHCARIISGIQPVELPRIRAILGVEEVERLPSFFAFGSLRPPGMSLPITTDLDSKSYEVHLFHPDPDQIAHDARAVRQLLRYV